MHRAKEIVLTGTIVDAKAAYEMGMVNKIVPLSELMNEARAMAQTLLSRPGVALAYAKKAMNSGAGMSLISGIDSDENFFARCFATYDQKEGMDAFTKKRKPVFKNK